MLTTEAYDDIIDATYAAALDPAAWRSLVEALTRGFSAVGASIFSPFAARYGLEPVWSTNADPEYIADYASNWAHSDPLIPQLMRRIPSSSLIYCFDDLVPRDELDAWDGFQAVKRRNVQQGIGLMVNCDGPRAGQAMVYTSEIDGPRVESIKHFMSRLERHFRRAMQIHWHLVELKRSQHITSVTLDMFRTGTVWLSRERDILYTNKEMDSILAMRDGITIKNQKLQLGRPDLTEWLSAAVRDVADNKSGAIAVERPSGAAPFRVNVVPLPTSATALRLIDAAAIAFVSEVAAPTSASIEAAAKIYGLTAAESRVAIEIVNGHDVQETSCNLGSSVNTVRTHVKAILAKAGVTRQADLILLFATMPQIGH